jgi:hypothetical protein
MAITGVSLGAAQTPAPRLELGQPVTREIGAGETHTYRVPLARGRAGDARDRQADLRFAIAIASGIAWFSATGEFVRSSNSSNRLEPSEPFANLVPTGER